MERRTIIAAGAGLLIGVGITVGVVAYTKDDMDNNAAIDHSMMSMADMSKQLVGLSGEQFDKSFIEMMIAHHEGAVDMSELSSTRAKHKEIKQLSKNIISAQKKEISEMKQWQINWDYMTSDSSMPDMNH